jgi:hypothetical protein
MRSSLVGLSIVLASLSATARADDSQPQVPKGEVAKYTFESSKIFPGTVRDSWVYVPRQ